MYHDSCSSPAFGYFSWSMRTNGMPNDEMPAPDGEQYFAMSLYFASGRWGNGEGIYDYRAEADRLLTDMGHRATDHRPDGRRHDDRRGHFRFRIQNGPFYTRR